MAFKSSQYTYFNRHEIDYKLSFKDEEIILKNLNLTDTMFLEINNSATKNKWYGSRLTLIRTFYGKNLKQVSAGIGIPSSRISAYENNQENHVPSKEIIDKLSFYFEVPNEFFTDKDIKIIINEQKKIEYVKE